MGLSQTLCSTVRGTRCKSAFVLLPFLLSLLLVAGTSRLALFRVSGSSMEPTIMSESWVLIAPRVLLSPRRNHVVLLSPGWPGKGTLIKRIVGLSGDCVNRDGVRS